MPDHRQSLVDIYANLKASLLGTKSDRIDKQIDGALSRIRSYNATRNRNAYLDTLKTLVSSIGGEPTENFLDDINRGGGIDTFQQGDRLTRYKEYEEIIRNIAYCQRALRVLTDNILSPDDISKKCLRIVTEEGRASSTSKNNDVSITRVKEINRALQIEKKLDQLIMTTMKKGDYFIEIIHSPKGQQALTIISDSVQISEEPEESEEDSNKEKLEFTIDGTLKELGENNTINEVSNRKTGNIVIEYNPAFGGTLGQQGPIRTGSSFSSTYKPFNVQTHSKDPQQNDLVDIEDTYGKKTKDNTEEKAKDKKDELKDKFKQNDKNDKQEQITINLSDIFITLHDPQYVVRLETERFRTCLGYLVFPKIDPGATYTSLWSAASSAVDTVCLKIIEKLQQKIDTGKDKIPKSGDLRDVVYKYIKDIKDQEDLKIRYVPPEMMSHWRIAPGGRYDPYGESILDYVKFDAKLYMALKTAMTIKRLTSATDKRIIKVETGLPRNAKNLVEMMKEGLRKRKYSIDQFGSVDTIPSHITTFEDIYIPTRDGKAFVEIDKMEFGPDPQQDTEPLKFMRDNIVANLNVPPAFVGVEENTCFSFNTMIRLLEGNSIELGRLVEEYEKNPDKFNQWVYSIDENHNIVPGKIVKALRTRKNADIVRVYLDNNKYEDCTPDHPWMMRDGSYKEAKDLKPQDSLMPLYLEPSGIKTKNNVPYMRIYNPGKKKWQLVHRMVSEGLGNAKRNDGMSVHHIDGNPLNNHPENLLVCSRDKHSSIHNDVKYNPSNQSTYAITEKRNCVICGTEFECNIRKNQTTCLSEACLLERRRLDGLKSWEKRKQEAGSDYELVKTNCASCGKEIEIYKKYYEEAKDHMVSCGEFDCGRKVSALKNTIKVPEMNCVVCGNPITQASRIIKDNLSQTCSIKCANTVLAHRRHHGILTKTNCIICNKEIEIKVGKFDRPRYHLCSEDCETEYNKIKSYSKKNQLPIEKVYDMWLNNELPHQEKIEQEEVVLNHKVVKIEFLQEKQDCYDLEIENYHNFALASGVFVHNSNRALLTVENILFARTIIAYQSEFSNMLKDLFEKVYNFVYPQNVGDIDHIFITLPPPKASTFEHMMEYLEQLNRILTTLEEMGVPKDYSKKKFLPDFDWEEIEKCSAENELKKHLGEEPQSSNDSAGFGGLGGIGGPMPPIA